MPRDATARRQEPAQEGEPEDRSLHPIFGDGPPPSQGTRISNGRIAIVMLLGAEVMLFTPLIGSYVVLRSASPIWPPLDQPRLPIFVTWLNTMVLLGSCLTMRLAVIAVARRSPMRLERWLSLTVLLGITFIGVQGFEWVRLIAHGLSVSSGVYAGTFYVLIGFHALHVLGAVIWLIYVLARARANRFSPANAVAVDLAAIYWFFVGGLWLVLFPIVYLY
jgi:cytochrome c oxidase subunit 3